MKTLVNKDGAHMIASLPKKAPARELEKFKQINGNHDFKEAVPGGYVDYPARTRHNGKVVYFNFDLARQMGLIPEDHPQAVTASLEKAVLDTFAIQIINEWDIENKTPVRPEDIKPNKYMATRYLQLQHPDKKGTTSGDGRSIWNGQLKHQGTTWDVSSCGTGATCLSPATAIEGKYFRTGSRIASYGCGRATVHEGLSAAVMSEVFFRNGLETERTLTIIEFPDHTAINVRASKSLIRPSHFFHHLRQENLDRLKSSVDFYIQRQINNGEFKKSSSKKETYEKWINQLACDFASAVARFESDYIFVWLDWDGDNILTNGGIIDYGSVRQFGLYHHEYRYEDVDQMSTTIPEQRFKARDIIQTFVQIREYLITGKKPSREKLKNDATLKLFDSEYDTFLRKNLLQKIGFNQEQSKFLMKSHLKEVENFRKIFSYFEKSQTKKGLHKVEDGITRDAIYCMRDILRELPSFLLNEKRSPSSKEFIDIIASNYASRSDKKLTTNKDRKIAQFIIHYKNLVEQVALGLKENPERVLLEINMRSSLSNKKDRITGDAVYWATKQILRYKKSLSSPEFQTVIEEFVNNQVQTPRKKQAKQKPLNLKEKQEKAIDSLIKIVKVHREGI